jgi:hypothetical protein
MSFDRVAIPVTTTGTAGSATGSATSDSTITGFLVDIFFDFHGSTPATADTTVSFATRGGTIATVTSSATDVLIAPRQKAVDNAGAAITDSHGMFLLNDKVTVSVAEADALTNAVIVYLRVWKP